MKGGNTLAICAITIALFLMHTGSAKADCVAVVPAGWQHVFWRHVVDGARQAAEDYQIPFKFRAPPQEGRVVAQRRIIADLEKEGCRAFVIAPIDETINNEVASLKKSGIPSVYIDRGTDGHDETLATIATDNYAAGRRAALTLAKQIGKAGKVALLRMQKNVVSTSARENGFLDAAKETGLTVELETYLGITTGDAMRATRKIVAQLEKVDGIFTPNESTTQGVLIALSHSTVHRPVHIGFDLNNSIAQAIQSGNLYATIVQDPYQMGYQGVKFITQEKHKSATPQKIETPIYLITKENLGEFR